MSTDKKQINIRMPESTRAKLDELARLEHRSISNTVEVLIEKAWERWTRGQD